MKLLMGNGRFDFDIVGESHHQSGLAGVAALKGHDEIACLAALLMQDNNPHDDHAVAVLLVLASGKAGLVGHLARADARKYRSCVADTGGPDPQGMLCRAIIAGGWPRADGGIGPYGVRLDLVLPLKFGTLRAWESWKQRLL